MHFSFRRNIISTLFSSIISWRCPLCSWELLWKVLYLSFFCEPIFPSNCLVYFCFSQWFPTFPTVTFNRLAEGTSLYRTGSESNHKGNSFFQLRKIGNTRRDQCCGVLCPFTQSTNKEIICDALWTPWLWTDSRWGSLVCNPNWTLPAVWFMKSLARRGPAIRHGQ